MMHRLSVFLLVAAIGCTTQNKEPQASVASNSTAPADSGIAATTAAQTLTTDSAIAFIRKAFQQINTMKLKSQKFKWTSESCNDDGTATYYFNDKEQIVKVIETGAIGDGSWTTGYYYQDGKFIFSLDSLTGGPAIGPAVTDVVRKYVYNDKVIRIMENKTYTTLADSLLTPASKEYKILDAYKTKNFGTAFCQ